MNTQFPFYNLQATIYDLISAGFIHTCRQRAIPAICEPVAPDPHLSGFKRRESRAGLEGLRWILFTCRLSWLKSWPQSCPVLQGAAVRATLLFPMSAMVAAVAVRCSALMYVHISQGLCFWPACLSRLTLGHHGGRNGTSSREMQSMGLPSRLSIL